MIDSRYSPNIGLRTQKKWCKNQRFSLVPSDNQNCQLENPPFSSMIFVLNNLYGYFHKWGILNGWFIMGNPIKMDDWGVPQFQETSICHLVGGLKHLLCSIMYGIILPIDFHIFKDGYCTTNRSCFFMIFPLKSQCSWDFPMSHGVEFQGFASRSRWTTSLHQTGNCTGTCCRSRWSHEFVV